MVHKPPLPENLTLPAKVNGWTHDPESNKNAHVWRGDSGRVAVGVFSGVGHDRMRVKVMDERVHGFARSRTVTTVDYETADAVAGHIECNSAATGEAVEKAVAWMDRTPPASWSHPRVPEAMFDPPVGYELDVVYVEDRATEIYYLREDLDPEEFGWRRGEDALADVDPEEGTPADAPYLYIHVWTGSGDATVALAPFTGAHGPGSKHWEVVPVIDCPDDCGIDVALLRAREWVREHVDAPEEDLARTGQTSLSNWGEMA